MKKIFVHTAFRFNAGGEIKQFPVGHHEVDDELAVHWFVQSHTTQDETAAVADEQPAQVEQAAQAEQSAAETDEAGNAEGESTEEAAAPRRGRPPKKAE